MKPFPHALLIGNGPDVPSRLLHTLAQQADFILAADGGANTARKANVHPHAIIGDFDSVSAATRRQFASARWIFVDNQNNTDLQKALDFLLARGYKTCTLVGFMGGRLDFTLGNALALLPYAKKMDIKIMGNGWQLFPISSRRTFTTRVGARVSLLPLTRCTGVCLTGLKFPLQNARLLPGTTRTLSNQAARPRCTVSLTRGTLLVYLETN